MARDMERFREYQREYQRQRRRDSQSWRDRRKESEARYRQRVGTTRTSNARRLMQVKMDRGCQHCGPMPHPAMLDFHHRDPITKIFHLGRSNGWNWAEIELEIAKCDVLCKNCHALLHAQPWASDN
jgi:hypothetical protein